MNKSLFQQTKQLVDQYGEEKACHYFIKKCAECITRLESMNFDDNNKNLWKDKTILHYELAELQIMLNMLKMIFGVKDFEEAYNVKIKHFQDGMRFQ